MDTDTADLRMPARASTLEGVLTALAIAAAALLLASLTWNDIAIPVATVVGVAAALYALLVRLNRGAGARRQWVASLAALGLVPLIGCAAVQSLQAPLQRGESMAIKEALFGVGVALAGFIGASAAGWWLGAKRRPQLERLPGLVAPFFLLGAAALIGQAAAKKALSDSSALEPVASLPAMADSAGRFTEQRAEGTDGEFAIGRTCIARHCLAHIRRGAAVRTLGPRFVQHASLQLHHASASEKLVLSADGRPLATIDHELASWRWQEPIAHDTRVDATAPVGFLVLAAFGLLGGCLALWWRRKTVQRLEALACWRVGVAQPNGWVHFEDGTAPLRLRDEVHDADAVEGAVLVEERARRRSLAYRGDRLDGSPVVHRGTRAEHERRARITAATAGGLACAWVLALAAPLLAAAVLGYVW